MATNKKTTKGAKNKQKLENEMEQQIKKTEKALEIIQKENERQEIIKTKTEIIREDLRNQLLSQKKFGKQFDDMVEDYIYFVRLKEDLQQDINDKGVRYLAQTGNGFKTSKTNESVQLLIKVNAQMLKILQDLIIQ